MSVRRRLDNEAGLLVLRVGIGLLFMLFGLPKLQAGVERWRALGHAMAVFGITFAPVFWGFMAMMAELFGGALLVLGLLVRPAAALLCFTMITATAMLVANGSAFQQYAHPLGLAIVTAALLLTGGGRLAVGALIPGLRTRWYA